MSHTRRVTQSHDEHFFTIDSTKNYIIQWANSSTQHIIYIVYMCIYNFLRDEEFKIKRCGLKVQSFAEYS